MIEKIKWIRNLIRENYYLKEENARLNRRIGDMVDLWRGTNKELQEVRKDYSELLEKCFKKME